MTMTFEAQTENSFPDELRRREVLNLGCGRKHVEGAVNLDLTSRTNPDVLHDLERFPWPLPDDHFREVLAFDVLEHLSDVLKTFEEIHRVCRDGAVVRVAVPHFSCSNAYTDPTHRRFFGYTSLDNLTEEGEFSFYTQARFRIRQRQIIFWPTLPNKIVWRLANRYPMWYELRWAWIFPALFVSMELEVVKGRDSA
ncbi:MAG: methyltransferase domain-containing protein [Acidobacteria bacterium]|nr:methyltransferase domain-containing protein [Acidobacteriota bacterium]